MTTTTTEQQVKALAVEGRAASVRVELYDALNLAARGVAAVNYVNGWYDDVRTFGDDVALLHSEVSEALEAFRRWGADDATGNVCTPNIGGVPLDGVHLHGSRPCKPEGVGSELADVFIRLLDTCSRYGIDLAAEFERKIQFNASRGHRHGGKLL
jgi:NTP pyrophosphatase (non-canonical NTP hydrolase)